jgi:hypothetical protein
MTEKIILPEGITYNNNNSNQIDLEVIEEVINDTKCTKCGLHFQAVLTTNGSRHYGIIRAKTNGIILWGNALPKDRTRSIKLLNENLIIKLDNHQERHKDD